MGAAPSKTPNSRCSHAGCDDVCVDAGGHRVRQPHKARICRVCNRWYCGTHKATDMKRKDKGYYNGTVYVSNIVYKCHGCVGTPRQVRAPS